MNDLRNSGIVPNTPDFNSYFNVAAAYRQGGDAIAQQLEGLSQHSQEKLQELRKSNSSQFNGLMHLAYNSSTATLDAAFLLNGISQQTGLSQAERNRAINSAAGTLAKGLFQTGVAGINGIAGGQLNQIVAAVQVASANMSAEDRLVFANTLNSYANAHANTVANNVSTARIATIVALAAGPLAEASPAIAACLANLVCLNEAGVTLGEMAAGEALGGGSLAVGSAAVATKQVENALEQAAAKTIAKAGQNSNTVIIGGKTCVYSCVVDGATRYVGITDDVARRGAEHLRTKDIRIEQIDGLDNLSRADAKAVEQTLINYYGLGKDGGTLLNKINSISATRNPTIYEQSLIRGKALLDSVDYQWTK